MSLSDVRWGAERVPAPTTGVLPPPPPAGPAPGRTAPFGGKTSRFHGANGLRVLLRAAAARPDGLSGTDVAVLLGHPDPDETEAVLRLGLRSGRLLAARRLHGADDAGLDHWRYFATGRAG